MEEEIIDSLADSVPSVAGRGALYAYKNKNLIQEYWTKLLVKLNVGRPSIIITGLPGAGKSVLASHYHGEANQLDWNLPGASNDVEVKPISIGDWTKIVSVIPGQENAERTRALDEAINKSKTLEGIIHVVDWGFISLRDNAIKQQMIEEGIDTLEKFRERNLRLEIENFKSLIEQIKLSLSNKRGPKWLVIAINKIDLFENEITEANKYYHPDLNGPFSEILKELHGTIGKQNFKVKTLPVCSRAEPFEWNGTCVKSIDSVTKQRNYLRVFIDEIAKFTRG